MAVDVDFDQGELDSNTQIILQASTKAQAEAVQKSYSILNDGINTFIKNYELAYQEINAFQNGLKEIIKNWHRIKNSLIISTQNYKESFQYLEYIKSRQSFMEKNFNERLKKITLDIYLLAFKIQQYLNAALGQKVATAYVFEQRGEIAPKVLLSTNMEDFLKVEVSSSGNLVLRYRQDQENLRRHIEKLQEQLPVKNEDQHYQKLITAYNKAHSRYTNFPLKNKRGSYVLWLYPYGGQKWNGVHVSSFGSINEAYAYFLFNLENFNPTNISEDDMEKFMNHLLTNVTNESGLLAGDFKNNLMEIAVKSADASVLGIKQIYILVKKIQKQKIQNFEGIVKFLQKEKEKNANKARPINKSLKTSLQNIADKYVPQAIGSLTK